MSSSLLNSERSQKWDILRFFLIFSVVLGHAADNYTGTYEHMRSLFFFIYIFHMPLFIFISGLFAKRAINEKRFDKIAGYLLLYFILNFYVYFVKLLAGKNPELHILDQGGAPWFMLALFAFNLITIAIRKAPQAAVFLVSIAAACIIGYFETDDFLALSRIFVYYPFFYLGYCIDREKLEAVCDGRLKKTVAAIIIICVAVLVFVKGDEIYWLRYLLTGRNSYYTALGDGNPCRTTPDINHNFGFLFRLAYFSVVLVVGLSIIILTPKKTPFGLCAKLGQRTLAVYGLHFGALYLIYKIFNLKSVFADALGHYHEWIIVPIALLITLFFSIKFFNTGLMYLMNLPAKIHNKLKSKEASR